MTLLSFSSGLHPEEEAGGTTAHVAHPESTEHSHPLLEKKQAKERSKITQNTRDGTMKI